MSLPHPLFLFIYNIRAGCRYLLLHRRTTALNLAGLVIGLVATLMIHLYLQFETSYDTWLPDAEKIFRVEGQVAFPGEKKYETSASSWQMLPALQHHFSEISAGTRVFVTTTLITLNGAPQKQDIAIVDPAFADVFKLPMASGHLQGTLASPSGVAINETIAKQLFTDHKAIGQTINITVLGQTQSYVVKSVFKNMPINSHFSMSIIVAFKPDYFKESIFYFTNWEAFQFLTYIKLRSVDDSSHVNSTINTVFDRVAHITDAKNFSDSFHYALTAIDNIHLYPKEDIGFSSPAGNHTLISAFHYITIVLLLMIIINFINLTSTEASGRTREMSIRRIFGGQKTQILAQLLVETALVMIVAITIALCVIAGITEILNAYLATHLALQMRGADSILPVVLGLFVVLVLIGGVYPAMTTVGSDIVNALSGRRNIGKKYMVMVRKILVSLQFLLATSLIICTGTIALQTLFGEADLPGFESSGLYAINHLDKTISAQQKKEFSEGLHKIKSVQAITHSDLNIFSMGTLQHNIYKNESNSQGAIFAEYDAVDYNTFKIFGIPILAGRAFSDDKPEDDVPSFEYAELKNRDTSTVLNMTAIKAYGFANAEAAIGKQVYLQSNTPNAKYYPATIIGVVGDARFGSLHTAVRPAYYHHRTTGFTAFTLRLAPEHRAETVAAIKTLFQRIFPDREFQAGYITELMAQQTVSDRLKSRAFILFSCLAVVIAAIGLFGLAAYVAESRQQEISVRRVFGAGLGHITKLLMREFMQPIIWANVVAWPVAFAAMHVWLSGFSKHIDTPYYIYLAAAVGGVELAVFTVAWHVRKIKKTDMADSLRYE